MRQTMMASDDKPLPVTVIGGYLGAGKTTLVNQLLRHAGGLRLAVLVNDFGEVSIDADLIESADEQVLNLAGGCVCCSIGSDLVSTLTGLHDRFGDIDHVLLETSGVALPGVVAATVSLAPGIRRDVVVVVCDALHGPGWLADSYLADTLQRQITAADCLVITKQALASPEAALGFSRQLHAMNTGAPQLEAEQPDLAAILLGRLESLAGRACNGVEPTSGVEPAGSTSPVEELRPGSAMNRPLTSDDYVCTGPADLDALVAVIAGFARSIFRAKGILTDLEGTQHLLQCVAGQSELSQWPGAADSAGHLVIIASLDREQRLKLETMLRNLGFYPTKPPLALNQSQITGKIRPQV